MARLGHEQWHVIRPSQTSSKQNHQYYITALLNLVLVSLSYNIHVILLAVAAILRFQ